jgi:hypothetical protein
MLPRRRAATIASMHLTVQMLGTVGAGWLMLRAGAAKKGIRVKVASRCASCGRLRGRGPCPCTQR